MFPQFICNCEEFVFFQQYPNSMKQTRLARDYSMQVIIPCCTIAGDGGIFESSKRYGAALLNALTEKEGQYRSDSLFVSRLEEAELKTRDERDTVSMLGKSGEESHVSKHRYPQRQQSSRVCPLHMLRP